MSVVPYPIAIVPQACEPVFISNTKASRSIFTKAVTTYERRGAHHGWRISYRNLSAANAARIETALKSLRGMANRCYIPMYGYTRRGSGFGSELITNGTFASGTTGWTGSGMNLSAPDYVLRGVPTQNPAVNVVASQGFSGATQYLPLAGRSILHAPSTLDGISIGPYFDDGTLSVSAYSTTDRGLRTAQLTPIATTGTAVPIVLNTGAFTAGVFVDCSFASLSRCALVDNGPNLLLQSDEFDTTWTPAQATIDDQALAGPDGQTVADYLVEDGTAATVHYVGQSVTIAAAAADYSFGIFLKSGNRTVALLEMVESTSGHTADAYFNLATGVAGNLTVSGANWTNVRAFVVAYGNGWYYCCIVARKVSAGTTLTARIYAGEAMGDANFTGLSQNSIGMWRATLAQSSVPTRPIATTTTATSGTSQTGAALHLKGLPVSTSGILLAGDAVQIIQPNGSQIVTAAAPLNSDAAGLGYFEFNGQLFESPADGAAVIDVTPLARCLLDQDSVSFPKRPGVYTDVDFTLVEDIQRA